MGGIMDAIFGGKSTTKTSGTSETTSEVDQLSKLVENLLAKSVGTITKGTEAERTSLDNVQRALQTYLVDPIATARETSKGAVDSAITNVLNRGLPGINTARTTSGGYDSTTTQLLEDNLTAEAARAGAEVEQKAIIDTANVQQQAINNIIAAIATGLDSTIISDTTEQTTREGTEESSTDATESGVTTGKGTARDRQSLIGGITGLIDAIMP